MYIIHVCHFSLKAREDGLIYRGTDSVVMSWDQSQQAKSHISPVDFVFYVHVLFIAWIKVINGTNHQHGSSSLFVFNV